MNSKPYIFELAIPTADGEFLALYSERGLCGLRFPSDTRRPKRQTDNSQLPTHIRRWHDLTAKALARALAGQPPEDLPPLDFSSGTDFQQQVWQALSLICCGQTQSYGQVASAIGNPKALRAVGGACGANPIPVLVPCHRVLAAHHRLGGFSGGLHWKRTLLMREGIGQIGELGDK